MPSDTGTHTTAVHRPIGAVAFYALLHLAVGAGIFLLTRETLPQVRTDIKILISVLAAILGAGFLRTWTSDLPEETFMAAILASLLSFLSYICVHLLRESLDAEAYGKVATYGVFSLLSAGLALVALYSLLLGGHRRRRR